jgi:hypothetical protein
MTAPTTAVTARFTPGVSRMHHTIAAVDPTHHGRRT